MLAPEQLHLYLPVSREDVEAMLNITLKETRVYQDAKAEGEAKKLVAA